MIPVQKPDLGDGAQLKTKRKATEASDDENEAENAQKKMKRDHTPGFVVAPRTCSIAVAPPSPPSSSAASPDSVAPSPPLAPAAVSVALPSSDAVLPTLPPSSLCSLGSVALSPTSVSVSLPSLVSALPALPPSSVSSAVSDVAPMLLPLTVPTAPIAAPVFSLQKLPSLSSSRSRSLPLLTHHLNLLNARHRNLRQEVKKVKDETRREAEAVKERITRLEATVRGISERIRIGHLTSQTSPNSLSTSSSSPEPPLPETTSPFQLLNQQSLVMAQSSPSKVIRELDQVKNELASLRAVIAFQDSEVSRLRADVRAVPATPKTRSIASSPAPTRSSVEPTPEPSESALPELLNYLASAPLDMFVPSLTRPTPSESAPNAQTTATTHASSNVSDANQVGSPTKPLSLPRTPGPAGVKPQQAAGPSGVVLPIPPPGGTGRIPFPMPGCSRLTFPMPGDGAPPGSLIVHHMQGASTGPGNPAEPSDLAWPELLNLSSPPVAFVLPPLKRPTPPKALPNVQATATADPSSNDGNSNQAGSPLKPPSITGSPGLAGVKSRPVVEPSEIVLTIPPPGATGRLPFPIPGCSHVTFTLPGHGAPPGSLIVHHMQGASSGGPGRPLLGGPLSPRSGHRRQVL
ncbi:hypothetical protein M427DRAFT_55650 [Gonapodya prolifera JEL478]|uniref:Uncharacterized protein n=1 Tax=Gonapodya prolifera (strain JEL478) TaxID=1344416 RepID=A0A139AHC1_GONPJ|nr:hypothetical protein M427DRAFT_55650 [Gonapodya prolifera JEL478]|eukprot:KXS16222.1 hypothetical protein M427DRAFT_55650 [Gonapodya prolifera JEL478]